MTKQKQNAKPSEETPQTELQAIAAEFPDFATIIAGASFGAGKWKIEGEDPKMRYYYAYPGSERPDSVESVKELGYRVSEKKHNCPDLILMETPRALYDLRMRKMHENQRMTLEQLGSVAKVGDPDKGLEALRSDGTKTGLRQRSGS
jgi:hypothetical protein